MSVFQQSSEVFPTRVVQKRLALTSPCFDRSSEVRIAVELLFHSTLGFRREMASEITLDIVLGNLGLFMAHNGKITSRLGRAQTRRIRRAGRAVYVSD
ncbi:MAG: hypothetical protein AAFV29_14430 [Myxococcota bacterium]